MRLNSKDGRRKVERDEQACLQVYINTSARYSYNTLHTHTHTHTHTHPQTNYHPQVSLQCSSCCLQRRKQSLLMTPTFNWHRGIAHSWNDPGWQVSQHTAFVFRPFFPNDFKGTTLWVVNFATWFRLLIIPLILSPLCSGIICISPMFVAYSSTSVTALVTERFRLQRWNVVVYGPWWHREVNHDEFSTKVVDEGLVNIIGVNWTSKTRRKVAIIWNKHDQRMHMF